MDVLRRGKRRAFCNEGRSDFDADFLKGHGNGRELLPSRYCKGVPVFSWSPSAEVLKGGWLPRLMYLSGCLFLPFENFS